MTLKGVYNSEVSYNVGDVVLFTDGVVYHLQRSAPAGTAPMDTRYWARVDPTLEQVVKFITDALSIESINNSAIASNLSDDALILKSSTENSEKEFLITVDDDGELTATEIEGDET